MSKLALDTLFIQPPSEAQLELLQDIELAAGELFAQIGMDEIAADEPPSLAELTRALARQHLWIAVADIEGVMTPVAYIMMDVVDDCAHIEQVSVLPLAQGGGVGRRLIDHVCQWAVEAALRGVTLTTFTDVAWNAPYYRRLGFSTLSEEALTPGLVQIRKHEAALGLDRWPRQCMFKPSSPQSQEDS